MYGKIIDIQCQIGSGIGIMFIQDENGNINKVPCDAGATLRALRGVYGYNYIGEYIEYEVDDNGILAFFLSDEDDIIGNYSTKK